MIERLRVSGRHVAIGSFRTVAYTVSYALVGRASSYHLRANAAASPSDREGTLPTNLCVSPFDIAGGCCGCRLSTRTRFDS